MAAVFAVLGVGTAAATTTPTFSATDVATCTGSSTVAVHIAAQNPPPLEQAADIVLVVDDSGSIGTTNFNTVRAALQSFVTAAAPSVSGNHIGVVEFDTTALNVTPSVGAATGALLTSGSAVNSLLGTMPYRAQNTNTRQGLEFAQDMLAGPGSRSTAPDVIVVVTDGNFNPAVINGVPTDPAPLATTLRAAGTQIFAVGVGSGISAANLLALGGDAAHVSSIADYQTLDDTLHDALLQAVPAATNLAYNVTAAPGWSISAASASAGTISHTPTGVAWSAPSINSATPTTVTIAYTEQHTGATGGPAVPLASAATLTYTDDAGNPQSVDYSGQTVSVSGCNRPPTAAIAPVPVQDLSGSHVAHVALDGSPSSDPDGDTLTYAWTAADALGPIDAVAQPTVDLPIGTHTVDLTVSDGFFSSTAEITVTVVDPSPPVVTANVSGAQHNGWYTGDPVVSFTLSDPESDITSTSPDCTGTTVSADTAGTTFTCTAESAGGTGSASATVQRDATGPSVVFGGNAVTYGLTDTVTITCTASDALSGLATPADCGGVSGPAYLLGGGSHTVTRSATDVAGNITTASTTYTVVVDAAGICALIEKWSDNAGVAHSLCVKLDKNNMRPFFNELAAQRGKHIPADKADLIRSLAGGL